MSRPGLLKRLARVSPRDLALCALTGVLTFASFPTALAPDWSFWPLIWISHVPLLWLLKDKAPRQAFRWGLLCGTIINGGGYYWIAELTVTFGHMPWAVGGLVALLHAAWLGVIWALWAWLINRIGNTTPIGIQWSAPLAMVGMELAVPRIFPAYMGNSQYPFIHLMQVVDLFGVFAITFLIYRVNAVLYLWLRAFVEGRGKPLRATWATLAMLAATLGYGVYRQVDMDATLADEAVPHLKVGIAENDIGIFEREPVERQNDHLLILQNQTAELQAAGAELVLWSESAYRVKWLPKWRTTLKVSSAPLVANARADAARGTPRADQEAIVRGFDVPVLLGGQMVAPRAEPRNENDNWAFYNTALLVTGKGEIEGQYDKVHRLVFGEYIPFSEYFPWVFKYIPAAGNLDPGPGVDVIESNQFTDRLGEALGGPLRIGVMICYEGILAGFTRELGPKRPHFITNLTNDDWFGDTAERWLHLALTVPRAIENRLAFVRATNTGVSAFVDPVGRMVKRTEITGAETLMWSVPLLQSTTVYQLIGDAFAWACLGLTLLFFLWGIIRRR